MGHWETFIQKLNSVTDEGKQEQIQKNLMEGKLTLDDVVEQSKSMSQMGSFEKIKSLIPGLGKTKIPEGTLEKQETKISKWQHIIKSMTKEEKENPEIFEKENSRVARVAQGAGVNNSDVRGLLKQYKMLKEMMKGGIENMDMSKGMSQKQLMKLAKKFGKKKMMRF